MYDSLSNDYDIPITATSISTNHDYDIPQPSGKKHQICTAVTREGKKSNRLSLNSKSLSRNLNFFVFFSIDFISNSNPPVSNDSSPESSSRSSGIYSGVDLRLSDVSSSSSSSSSTTSEFHTSILNNNNNQIRLLSSSKFDFLRS